ncbi:MAG: hypothetical protein S0880_30090 [Actinomycetota bacterium]|nr:hypothetical protein [Actinomycetota bacterium]
MTITNVLFIVMMAAAATAVVVGPNMRRRWRLATATALVAGAIAAVLVASLA